VKHPSAGKVSELRHHLRTPVNHIVGYAEMLLEDAEDAEVKAALERALGGAREALGLIDRAVGGDKPSVTAEELMTLREQLRTPQRAVVEAMHLVLDRAGTDTQVASDAHRILSAAARLVEQSTEPAVPATVKRPVAGTSARILVVDDVDDNREVLRRRLEREGYAATAVADGEAALAAVASGGYDLVLLDVLMPGLDGPAVLERLKADRDTRHIPVIMISAMDDLQVVVHCIEAGAADYLTKPFDPVLLRARVGACLEQKRLRDHEREYLAQVNFVIEAASAVEGGTYKAGSLDAITGRGDALGKLARVFDTMATQVRAREDRLRSRVRDLQSEIAVARRSTQSQTLILDGGNLVAGDHLAGRYEIIEAIGRGGMGAVYRARDTELEEVVAIKTVRPELLTDPIVVERFKDEIRLARRLTHRNVVRTHDFGEFGGVYYLTMEFVEGITVRELLDTRGRLAVGPVLAIAAQLAESLALAHEQGIVHRDIKPQNLLLDADGVLKVMDFGIARLAARRAELTEAGLVVGTPAYMPPEQLLAEPVDARSDLYAVGVVLYECLTGVLPFEADSPISLIARVLNDAPRPPVELNDEIPPPLSEVILRLLAKKPDDRVQTAAELGRIVQSAG